MSENPREEADGGGNENGQEEELIDNYGNINKKIIRDNLKLK